MIQILSYFSALEYTGGVPYDLLKPVLQHATPEQLFMLEHHNPYLIEDTGELWQFHCQREFRTKHRQDMETAREMYLVSSIAMILQLGLAVQMYCCIVSILCSSSCFFYHMHPVVYLFCRLGSVNTTK
jgi:hypothetical protein